MRISKRNLVVFWIPVTGLFIIVGVQVWNICSATKKVSYTMAPFERKNPEMSLKILFLGDSTAVGTGAENGQGSVAGWFAQDFPQASIENRGGNGKRLAGLSREFIPSEDDHWTLIIIQIGANDILRWTNLAQVKKELSLLLDRAQKAATHVLILHSGDVGMAPIFTWPFDWIYSIRSRQVRDIYLDAERKTSTLYVDLLDLKIDEPMRRDVKTYYAPDHLHLSGRGYRVWYGAIRQELDQAGIDLFKS